MLYYNEDNQERIAWKAEDKVRHMKIISAPSGFTLRKDEEPVKLRLAAESCGSGRNFLGRDKITQKGDLTRWVNSLLSDLYERLDEYKEDDGVVPKKLIVHLAWVRGFCETKNNLNNEARIPRRQQGVETTSV